VLAVPIPNFAEDQEVVEINTRGYEVLIEELPLSTPRLVFQAPEVIEEEASVEAQTATNSVSNTQAATAASASTPGNSSTNVATTSTVTTTPVPSSTASSSAEAEIVFQVVKESWIDVRDSTGERLIYRTVNRGEDIRLQGKPPYSIFIGSAEGVTVQYRGKVVPFKAHESGLFARFEVGG
jgi:cytoskeleton protein RodZ